VVYHEKDEFFLRSVSTCDHETVCSSGLRQVLGFRVNSSDVLREPDINQSQQLVFLIHNGNFNLSASLNTNWCDCI
jgi:hypothetical protein